ncbi:helix-turn-helix domain-containing protein [Allobranchiibius sp. GilTou73]|uniref:helix-turn-helix domain-containing protein n=1 Tax=Allobranchiibius sp. GilTou73 TaxID=2904523 RepID=UPI001F2AC7C4|nr:helix-turn-helix domain-containing protein [Allobranchiibius sp. GilTou73]UIJ33363.1 helix-turn-helix domain-containing protein [Allobranchiibius sp. GilTou73]
MNTAPSTTPPDLGILDDEGVCRVLGISDRQLARLRSSAQIRWSTLGHSRRYRVRDLEDLLDRTANGAGDVR